MKMWNCVQKADQVGLSSGVRGSVCFLWEAFSQLPTSWCSPQKPYLNHKCLSFLNRSQVLVSWGIFGAIKAWWQWLSPLGPPQGSALLLTSPFLPSQSSNGSAPKFWLVQHSTQKSLLGSMSLFFLWLSSSLLPCSGSSLGLSKTIQFCHMAKSSWHPFSMLIRGLLWIFTTVPGASERINRRDENDR